MTIRDGQFVTGQFVTETIRDKIIHDKYQSNVIMNLKYIVIVKHE